MPSLVEPEPFALQHPPSPLRIVGSVRIRPAEVRRDGAVSAQHPVRVVDLLLAQKPPDLLCGEADQLGEITVGGPPPGLHVAQRLDDLRPAGVLVADGFLLLGLALLPVAPGQLKGELIAGELVDRLDTGLGDGPATTLGHPADRAAPGRRPAQVGLEAPSDWMPSSTGCSPAARVGTGPLGTVPCCLNARVTTDSSQDHWRHRDRRPRTLLAG